MKHIILTLGLATVLAATAHADATAAPWSLEWSQTLGNDKAEPLAVLVGRPGSSVRVVGTTLSQVGASAGEPADTFRWTLDAKGQSRSVEQVAAPRNQYVRGATRSWLGTEGRLQLDGPTGAGSFDVWEIVSRTSGGRERWRFQGKGDTQPTSGVVRDFWGNHWVAARPNNSSKPYQMWKVDGGGKLSWIREATGPERMGYPRILRRTSGGELVMGIMGAAKWVACYDKNLRHKWTTELEKGSGVPRDIAFGQNGEMFVTVVIYDPSSNWHTKVWKLSAKGEVLGSLKIDEKYFSGWRIATDGRGFVYLAGMAFGEPGFPVLFEFDTKLKQVGRFEMAKDSRVFVDSLHVSSNGKEFTVVGSATRWLGQQAKGPSDAFVARFRRSTAQNAANDVPSFPPIVIEPRKATDLEIPW
jgi:hypothetical protein